MKLLIVDDHAIIRDGLKLLLSKDFDNILEAEDGNIALEILANLNNLPDVILLDILMPNLDGIGTMKIIANIYPNLPVVVLTTVNKTISIQKMLKLGAKGYVLKDAELSTIKTALMNAISGQTTFSDTIQRQIFQQTLDYVPLSNREIEVLQLLVDGRRNKEIAKLLFLSERTIRANLTSIYQKFDVETRSEAVAFALKNQIV